jgi:hypothetical protein
VSAGGGSTSGEREPDGTRGDGRPLASAPGPDAMSTWCAGRGGGGGFGEIERKALLRADRRTGGLPTAAAPGRPHAPLPHPLALPLSPPPHPARGARQVGSRRRARCHLLLYLEVPKRRLVRIGHRAAAADGAAVRRGHALHRGARHLKHGDAARVARHRAGRRDLHRAAQPGSTRRGARGAGASGDWARACRVRTWLKPHNTPRKPTAFSTHPTPLTPQPPTCAGRNHSTWRSTRWAAPTARSP